MNQNFESLTKFIVFLAVPLVVYGVLFNHVYYSHYGIIITQYIDLTEAILLFIPELFKIIFLVLYSLVVYFIVAKTGFPDHPMFSDIPKTSKIGLIGGYILATIATFILWETKYLPSSVGLRILLLLGLIFFFPLLVKTIFMTLTKNNKIQFTNLYMDFLFVTIVIFGIVLNSAVQKIEKNSRRELQTRFEILLDDDIRIKNDSNTLFLGKTKEYVFIYNIVEKNSRVLKMENTKTITISNSD